MNTDNIRHALANIEASSTKKAAWEALSRVLDDIEIDRLPNRDDLASLYQHFRPAAPKQPKTWWDWVAAPAVSAKADHRHYLHWVHVTAEYAESTDRHRIHRVPAHLVDVDPGFYWPTGEPVSDPDNYPDVDRVIPDRDGCVPLEFVDVVSVDDKTDAHRYQFESGVGEFLSINKRYSEIATAPHTRGWAEGPVITAEAEYGNPKMRVDYNNGALVVVMPLRKV